MKKFNRMIIALLILLSGLVLLPKSSLLGGVVRWQQFTGGYGGDGDYHIALPLVARDAMFKDVEQ